MSNLANRYTAQVPPTSKFRNVDTNSLASTYAATYSHDSTALIERVVRELIYDASPEQYLDLKLLSLKTPRKVTSDEFFYHEMGFGRDPIIANATAVAGATQTFALTAASFVAVSVDTIIIYPDGVSRGTVTAKNTGTNEITVTALTGQTLPAVAVNDIFALLSPVEADGMNTISQYFRQETVERFNYVQMLIKAVRFGRMELFKYEQAGSTSNYIQMQKQRCIDQFRVDLSNILWNGERGEVTLANGMNAKTTGGIYPLMIAAGSFNVTSSTASLKSAIEDAALSTEYKKHGYTRFLYGSPRMIYEASKAWKDEKVRYNPGDRMGDVYLEAINIGSSKIVFVPMQRFEEQSCFPASWANRMILVDQETIQPVQCWGEEMGQTLPRKDGGTRENFQDFWIHATFGLQYDNPLGGAIINVN